MKFDKNILLLYAVTNENQNDDVFYNDVELALKSGVTCLQLREKNLATEKFTERAKKVKALCDKYNVALIINDNIGVAIKSGADGIHVGQNDASAKDIKRRFGKNLILGVSAHNVNEAFLAQEQGADYLGLGAAFATNTKTDIDIMNKQTMKEICESVKIPSVAIGGISYDNMDELKDTGISGIAVVSAIFSQKNIDTQTQKLLTKAKRIFKND